MLRARTPVTLFIALTTITRAGFVPANVRARAGGSLPDAPFTLPLLRFFFFMQRLLASLFVFTSMALTGAVYASELLIMLMRSPAPSPRRLKVGCILFLNNLVCSGWSPDYVT